MNYICINCGYVYNEKQGDVTNHIPPNTKFSDLPDNWVCPVCYVKKNQFDCFD